MSLINTVPPRWILEPTDKAFAQGSDAKIECKSDGFPKPQVTWKKAVGEFIIYIYIYSMIHIKLNHARGSQETNPANIRTSSTTTTFALRMEPSTLITSKRITKATTCVRLSTELVPG